MPLRLFFVKTLRIFCYKNQLTLASKPRYLHESASVNQKNILTFKSIQIINIFKVFEFEFFVACFNLVTATSVLETNFLGRPP